MDEDIIVVGAAAAVKAQQATRAVCLAFDEHEEKRSRKRTYDITHLIDSNNSIRI